MASSLRGSHCGAVIYDSIIDSIIDWARGSAMDVHQQGWCVVEGSIGSEGSPLFASLMGLDAWRK